MNNRFLLSKIQICKRLQLGEKQVILIDGADPILGDSAQEKARNIFLYDALGCFIWRVASNNDVFGDSFTNIYFEDGLLKAYRWDGGQYIINSETGFATPEILLK